MRAPSFLLLPYVLLFSVYRTSDAHPSRRVVLFERVGVPRGWVSPPALSDHTAARPLNAVLPLRHNDDNIRELESRAGGIFSLNSEPHVLDAQDIAMLTAPLAGCKGIVRQWIHSCGINSVDEYHDAFTLGDLSTDGCRCLFNATVSTFVHTQTNVAARIAFGPVSLPTSVSVCVPFIGELSDLPLVSRRPSRIRRKAKQHSAASAPQSSTPVDPGAISPSTLASLYNVPAHLQAASSKVVVAEFLGGATRVACNPPSLQYVLTVVCMHRCCTTVLCHTCCVLVQIWGLTLTTTAPMCLEARAFSTSAASTHPMAVSNTLELLPRVPTKPSQPSMWRYLEWYLHDLSLELTHADCSTC